MTFCLISDRRVFYSIVTMNKTKKDEMSFLEHLEELRWHLIRSFIAIGVFSAIGFIYKSLLFDKIILGPTSDNFITNRLLCTLGRTVLKKDIICINSGTFPLQNIDITGQFLSHIKIALVAGLIAAFPYILYELWRFISPALYAREKKYAGWAVVAVTMLFFTGVVFGYFVICPLSVNFLINYKVSALVANDIKLMSYVSLVTGISFAAGLLFELPAVIYFLSKIGLVTPDFLKHYRKHAIVVILLIAAIITPPDVFSQILVSFPLFFLYEVSISISRRINRKREVRDVQAG
jgi:sec-independent protein translocase protein TatC